MAAKETSIADLQREVLLLKAAARKRTKKKPERALKVEVRRNYRVLRDKDESYDLDLRVDCLCNRKVTEKVIRAVKGTLGDSYTAEEITEYCHSYFNSLREDHRRKQNGNFNTHRKRSGRSIRLNRKSEKRKLILQSDIPPPLSTEQMVQAKEMLAAGNSYMSSDESDTEEGDCYGRVRKVRRLAWESQKMKDIKDIIDNHGLQCASKQSKAKMVLLKRDSSCDISLRPVPKNILNWAVDVFYAESGP